MSLLFVEGFDHYASTAQLVQGKWTSIYGTSSTYTTLEPGRFPGSTALALNYSSSYLSRGLGANPQTVIIGLAVHAEAWPSSEQTMFVLREGGNIQIGVRAMPTGQLSVYRGSTSNILGTSVQGMTAGAWHYLELKVTIDNAGGSVELRVNGSPWIAVSGIDTQSSGNAWVDELRLLGWVEDLWFDDLYVCDAAGTANNDFLGDCRVITLAPDADGTVNDFTPQSGGANHVEVDDGPSGPDEDTTYVSASAVGAKDLFGYPAPGAQPGVIKGVAVTTRARKTDAGTRAFRALARSGTTETAAGASHDALASYADSQDIFETDPETGTAWTEAGFAAAEFGIEITA
jgi:hypothetical protein